MRLAALLVAALAALLPAASAHTTVYSDDDRYRIVVGLLDEPVVTYQRTGLDLCFQHNTTAREPVTGIHATSFAAALVAPGGERLENVLVAQFGRPGCFQFAEPFVLTRPGQYTFDLTADLDGTAVRLTGVKAGGEVDDLAAITFPDKTDSESLNALAARVAALEAQASDEPTGASGPVAAGLLAVGLLAAAGFRRRSA